MANKTWLKYEHNNQSISNGIQYTKGMIHLMQDSTPIKLLAAFSYDEKHKPTERNLYQNLKMAMGDENIILVETESVNINLQEITETYQDKSFKDLEYMGFLHDNGSLSRAVDAVEEYGKEYDVNNNFFIADTDFLPYVFAVRTIEETYCNNIFEKTFTADQAEMAKKSLERYISEFNIITSNVDLSCSEKCDQISNLAHKELEVFEKNATNTNNISNMNYQKELTDFYMRGLEDNKFSLDFDSNTIQITSNCQGQYHSIEDVLKAYQRNNIFQDCHFEGVNFSNTDLSEAQFSTRLYGCVFRDCNFRNTNLKNAKFSGLIVDCDFTNAKVENCTFEKVKLTNVLGLNRNAEIEKTNKTQTKTKTEQYNQEKETLLKEIIEKFKEKKSFGPVIDRFERLQNPVTGTKYSGFNRIYLAHQIENAGWKDPRFITFAQAKKLGYYLKPGQHASRVVYKEPKQKVFKLEGEELKAAQAANKPEEKTVNFFVNKTFLVFNANQFKNFPELEKFTYSTEQQHEIISNMKANAAKSIKITETGVGRAFYSPGKDTITLPLPATIKNDEAAARNFFHELAHATGHESRLNRQLEYHEEEVVAELASSFLYKEFGFQSSEAGDHYSKEYIRGWAQVEKSLDENPNNLMKYVTLAEQTVAYMKEQYVDRELLLKDQLLEMPQEPAKETKIFTEQIQPVAPASIQYSIEPAKEILIELDSKNGKTFYEADRNVLDYTVAARTKNKLHEPIASFVKDYQPIGLKFRFSADTGKDPLLYGLCSGNQNVKNTLLQAIQQDIQKAAPTTVRYNQKGLER